MMIDKCPLEVLDLRKCNITFYVKILGEWKFVCIDSLNIIIIKNLWNMCSLGIKSSTSVWVLVEKIVILPHFASISFCFFLFHIFILKNMKKLFSTSVWSEQHQNAGCNIQLVRYFLAKEHLWTISGMIHFPNLLFT